MLQVASEVNNQLAHQRPGRGFARFRLKLSSTVSAGNPPPWGGRFLHHHSLAQRQFRYPSPKQNNASPRSERCPSGVAPQDVRQVTQTTESPAP